MGNGSYYVGYNITRSGRYSLSITLEFMNETDCSPVNPFSFCLHVRCQMPGADPAYGCCCGTR
eukprot:1487444-Rhodomonas_salina.2